VAETNLNDWLSEHGDYLYRFALARLKDPHQAEDAVQETMLAAIKNNSLKVTHLPEPGLPAYSSTK
jgi:RNA polymerase sigma-70 factor (ECF subfamily)